MGKISITALHGMMGSPSDFDCFSESDLGVEEILTPNLLDLKLENRDTVLLGYSLGGRVALQLALQNPHLFKGLILVSTHPGLKTDEERSLRLSQDLVWIEKMAKLPKECFFKEWEEQEIFKNATYRPSRINCDLSYQAEILRKYSLGKQEDLRPKINNSSLPILFLTGEFDLKYKELVKEIKGFKRELKGASHRALFENKNDFITYAQEFINTLK